MNREKKLQLGGKNLHTCHHATQGSFSESRLIEVVLNVELHLLLLVTTLLLKIPRLGVLLLLLLLLVLLLLLRFGKT
jgi:hypothetical protein